LSSSEIPVSNDKTRDPALRHWTAVAEAGTVAMLVYLPGRGAAFKEP